MLNILQLMLGLPVLLLLLYVPGAVVLGSIARKHPSPLLFSGRDEWLFTAVLISVLVTGLTGFVLAEVGLFQWWLILAIVLLFSLITAALLGPLPAGMHTRAPLLSWARSLAALLSPPSSILSPQPGTSRREARMQTLALITLLILAAALFSRPAEMLRGALDSGVYINAGVALARTGAILQRDPLMRALNDDKGEGNELLQGQSLYRYSLDRLRLSGFYVLDKKAALVLPQHYSLYPSWIALLYSLFGIWGALYATPLLALLAALAVYYFARRALSPGAALVALALLVLCPVTIWFARYPVSEVPTALLAFSAFYAFLRMMQLHPQSTHELRIEQPQLNPQSSTLSPQPWATLYALIAGVSLGEMALARPDFLFYLAPVPIYLLYWRLTRTWRPAYTAFTTGLFALLTLYTVHIFFFGFAYTLDLYHNVIQNVRRLWGPLLLALYSAVALVLLLDRLHLRMRPIWARAREWAVRYRWAWASACMLIVGGYATYHYLVGPWQPNIRFDSAGRPIAQQITTTLSSYIGAPVDQGAKYNLLRIGWYLSPLGIALGVLGLLRWIWGRLNAATWLFFGSLIVVSFVFIQETYTEAHYIYTMRRYITIILPALIMGVAWICQLLWSRLRPRPVGALFGGGLALALAVFFIFTARTIVSHVEEQGALSQLTQLAAQLGGKSVVIFSNERDEPNVVATPLQYIFGIESFVANRTYPNINNKVLEGVVTGWQNRGYKVWVLMGANGGKLHFPNLSLKEEGSWDYSVPELEQLREQKPFNISRSYLPWGIYSVQPKSPSPQLPFTLTFGNMDYKWLVAGFYSQEQAKGDTSFWRWTGPTAVLRLPIPFAPDGKTFQSSNLKLRLRPETPVPGQTIRRTEPVTVTLSLENTPVGQITVPPGSDFTDYAIKVPQGIPLPANNPDGGLLSITSSPWSARQSGISYDSRTLGIQIASVALTP